MTTSDEKALLKNAARAAGYETAECYDTISSVGTPMVYCKLGPNHYFNPLDNDGDALRLVVKLRMTVEIDDDVGGVEVWCGGGHVALPAGDDVYAATRRAIVCAAARVGAAMRAG